MENNKLPSGKPMPYPLDDDDMRIASLEKQLDKDGWS